MARQNINIGLVANDGTGDDLRVAMQKVNDNFTELYGASPFGQQITIEGNQISSNASNANLKLTASGTGVIELEGVQIRDNHIEATRSNDDLILSASGTGNILVGAVKINGTTLSSDDSSLITLAENVDVTGSLKVSGNLGFFGTTPIAQESAIAFDPAANDGSTIEDLRTTINEILTTLRNYGLIAS